MMREGGAVHGMGMGCEVRCVVCGQCEVCGEVCCFVRVCGMWWVWLYGCAVVWWCDMCSAVCGDWCEV